MYVESAASLHRAQEDFLHEPHPPRTPFVIGLAGLGGGRQVDHGPRAAAHAGALAGAPVGRAGDHRRLPVPQRRARAAGAAAPQGLSRSPTTAAALLRFVMDIKSGKDEVEAPTYSHLTYDVVPDETVVVQEPRHRDRRGPQRAPAGAGPRRRVDRPGDQRLLRLLRLRRRRHQRHPALVRRPLPPAAGDRLPRPGVVLHAGTPSSTWSGRSSRPTGSGTRSTGPTCKQNVQPTRGRATLVLRKAADHSVRFVRLRKL